MTEKKYEMLVRRSREIIAEYDMKLTIRQVYYRLVSNNDILNNRSQYVYFDKCLTDARKKDLNLAQYFEDRTRKIMSNIDTNEIDTFSHSIKEQIEYVKTGYPYLIPSKNRLQKKITIILLEKQALENIFERAIGNTSILITSRGFNSFTQMNELRQLIENDDRKINLYAFSDYDDSGLLIQKNFIDQMKKYLNIEFDNIERTALTDELIQQYSLPHNPTKKSTHTQGHKLKYFVELDALEPKTLTSLIKGVCKKNYDFNLNKAIEKAFKIRNRRLKKTYFKQLKNIDLSKI